MSTKRVPIRRTMKNRITPEALAVWLVLREIAEDPTDRDEYEPVGRHREYMDLNFKLCGLLGFWPYFMNFPIETDSATPERYMLHNPDRAENWREAYRWRCLLLEAEGAYERSERDKGLPLGR